MSGKNWCPTGSGASRVGVLHVAPPLAVDVRYIAPCATRLRAVRRTGAVLYVEVDGTSVEGTEAS